MNVQERLAELDERLAEIRGRMRQLQAEAIGIEAERDALLSAEDAPYVSRSEEVLRFLESMSAPCKVGEIVEHLRRLGSDDESSSKVSATLGHLRSQGKVVRVGHGAWRSTS